ncbi:MAG: ABC transporter permease [Ignisphaera sp.]|nr:ABC transporter permease [Ignisphaera sp.]
MSLVVKIFKSFFNLLVVLLLVITIIFLIARLFPGDIITVLYGETASIDSVGNIVSSRLGLDKPLHIQLLMFLRNVFTGNWGISIFSGEPVILRVFKSFVNSLALALLATATTTVLSIVLAYIAFTGKCWRLATAVASISSAMPTAVWGLLLMALLVALRVKVPFNSIVMPLATLTLAGTGTFYAILKGLIDNAMSEQFVEIYNALGYPRHRTFIRVLRYVAPAYIVALIYRMGLIVAGSIATEALFQYPGMGMLLLDAFSSRDYPVLIGWGVMVSATLAVFNLVGDVLQSFLDPRLRDLHWVRRW